MRLQTRVDSVPVEDEGTIGRHGHRIGIRRYRLHVRSLLLLALVRAPSTDYVRWFNAVSKKRVYHDRCRDLEGEREGRCSILKAYERVCDTPVKLAYGGRVRRKSKVGVSGAQRLETLRVEQGSRQVQVLRRKPT